jgi:hypothetical protein
VQAGDGAVEAGGQLVGAVRLEGSNSRCKAFLDPIFAVFVIYPSYRRVLRAMDGLVGDLGRFGRYLFI